MAIERRFARPILVGHCCSLVLQEDDERRKTIDAVARAGIGVVSLPMCNLFLQDRHRRPHAALARCYRPAGTQGGRRQRDDRQRQHARSVLPYGDLDMMEIWREGVRILHLDYPFADWAPAVARRARAGDGVGPRRICAPAARADMILTRARDFHRASRPPAVRSHRGQKWPGVDRRAARLCRTRRPQGPRAMSRAYDIAALESAHRSDQVRGQSHSGKAEEPRLLLVFAGAEARARGGDRRPRRHAFERSRSPRRPRRRLPARDSGHAARGRHRQLRPGDAADGRRAAQSRRDEQGAVDRAGPRRLRARAP